jgi:hypothetical protein
VAVKSTGMHSPTSRISIKILDIITNSFNFKKSTLMVAGPEGAWKEAGIKERAFQVAIQGEAAARAPPGS